MKVIEDKELNISGEQFDTFDEIYRVSEARPFNKHYYSDYMSKDSAPVKPGLPDYSWEQTKESIKFGSDIFNDEFDKVLKEVSVDAETYMKDYVRNRTFKDVVGQSVVIERAMMGHPKSFNHRKPYRQKRKTVSFIYNIACSSGTSTKSRLKAGCIMMAVAQSMEKMGYQTEIYLAPRFSFKNEYEPTLVALVKVKDFKTRFNLKKFQFPLAAESVLYQLGHWAMHRMPEMKSNWGSGEGRSVDYNYTRKENAKKFARKNGAVYLSVPMMKDDFRFNINSVFGYVFDQMKEM